MILSLENSTELCVTIIFEIWVSKITLKITVILKLSRELKQVVLFFIFLFLFFAFPITMDSFG